MSGSAARFSCLVAFVATVGCGFKAANSEPMSGTGGGGHAGAGGGAGTTGGAGRGGGLSSSSTTPVARHRRRRNVTGTLDANCGVKTQSAKAIPPDIMLVMDRSLSMTNDIERPAVRRRHGNQRQLRPNSKWELMVPALNDVITGPTRR
jgi:hypothetical protein